MPSARPALTAFFGRTSPPPASPCTSKFFRGGGGFFCGEETALLISIEGKRGNPRQRPPFPANKGLFGKPTTLNNVETWSDIPLIILNGADWFASVGTEKSKGRKPRCRA